MKSIQTLDSSHKDYRFLYNHYNLRRNRSLYLALILVTTSAILLTPWIKIESVVTSPGTISYPRTPDLVRSEMSGTLRQVKVENDSFVLKGDTLFSIRTDLGIMLPILAPEEGHIRFLGEFPEGKHVNKEDTILEITQKSDLLVKCDLTQQYISSIRPDQTVKYQFESGPGQGQVLKGQVKSIISTARKKKQMSIYEIYCSIDPTEVCSGSSQLAPGKRLLTRFRLARRSAFDIIRKKDNS